MVSLPPLPHEARAREQGKGSLPQSALRLTAPSSEGALKGAGRREQAQRDSTKRGGQTRRGAWSGARVKNQDLRSKAVFCPRRSESDPAACPARSVTAHKEGNYGNSEERHQLCG
nr:MAG TPA_asm: hypothetical protein [Caudoviricetes sp.]